MEAGEREEEVGDADRPLPEVINTEISRGVRWTGEEVRGVVVPVTA